MFALPFFRRDLPAMKGERVTLRLPEPATTANGRALGRQSRSFLEPWEPRWTADELDRTAWRQRLRATAKISRRAPRSPFFIFDNDMDALLGGITLGNIRHGVAQTGQIGYWMGERHAGHGHMVEALGLLIPLQLRDAAVAPCRGGLYSGKRKRSIRLLEKAGFRREGCCGPIFASMAFGRIIISLP